MILGYGMSLIGTSHAEKNGICQDAYKIAELENGWTFAAVADGVGSSKHSDIAAKMAVQCSFDFIVAQNLKWNDQLFNEVLPKAFAYAQAKIEEQAVIENNELFDYDTTLSLVLYNGEEIAFGHTGDGGIVGLTNEGDYISVTKPLKGSDGFSVIPLRAGIAHWVFGKRNEKYASVLLATDGVYDNFFPYLLRGQPTEVYVPLIRFFMDNEIVELNKRNRDKIERQREEFLCGENCASITDDKTVVVIVNTKIYPKKKEKAFYAEPNWDVLKEAWNRKAYPHLYKSDEASEEK